jgi:predicted DNA-binding protein (MmcQ/YjbR family)
MDVEAIQSICEKFPSVTQDIKWGHDLAFSIGGKMFCVVSLAQSPISGSFKVRDEEFEEMSNWPGFKPAPYVSKYKWVLIEDVTKMKKSDWQKYLWQSYNLVKEKLPGKIKNSLD